MSARRTCRLPQRGRLLGPEAIIGYSTHTAAQIEAAVAEPVTYIAIGPVFGTATKDTGYEPVGLEAGARGGAHRWRDRPSSLSEVSRWRQRRT